MEQNKEYFAFISYKREDEEWAKWFQNELENYHLPSSLNGRLDILDAIPENFRPPKEFRPVFRDIDELKAGNLPEQIEKALQNSLNLVVICSSHLSDDEKAKWVNKEISYFIAFDKDNIRRVFPFIVDGIPHSGDENECFPKVLRNLSKEQERIGGNVNEGGNVSEVNRERAFVKVLAGMLPESLSFNMLWDKYDIDKRAREIREKEQRDKLLIAQSRFLAEKAIALVEEGDSYTARLLALEALPKDLKDPNRPYVIDAESALRKASLYETAILRGHTKSVNSATFSPDGRKIVSASVDGTVKIWDSLTGRELLKLTETDSVYSASFSPDGERIVSVSWPDSIRIWNVQTGRELTTLKGHVKGVKFAAFSPDGKQIITVSNDILGSTIKIWDSQTGQEIRELRGHTVTVGSAAFSPDGKRIISISGDKTIIIWDLQTGQELRRFEQFEAVDAIAFSPNGDRIVSISNRLFDHTIRILDAYTGLGLKKLEGHTGRVNSAVFSPDGKYIVSASDDGTVRVWDSHTGEQIGDPLKGHSAKVNSAIYSPDGRQIVSASEDKTVRIWDVSHGREMNIDEGEYAAFSPDGKHIVSASNADEPIIRIFDVQTGLEIRKLEENIKEVRYADISPDGKRIVSASWDNIIRIWNVQTGQEIIKLEGHSEIVLSVAFSPDGKRLVSTSDDRTARIWDVQKGMEIITLRGHVGTVRSAVFSPDGQKIVSASNDETIRIWDVLTGLELMRLEGHTGSVNSVAYSPDGKQIVSASNDGTVRIWDAIMGIELIELEGHEADVNSVAFSPDGKQIVSASNDETIRIWDAQTGKELNKLCGHSDDVKSAIFSPDGKQIISTSKLFDKTIRIWDAQTGKELMRLEGDFIAISPDGKQLFSTSYSDKKIIRISDVQNGQELMQLKGHTGFVNSVTYSPDCKKIVSASGKMSNNDADEDNAIILWDAQTGQKRVKLKGQIGAVNTAFFSPDGKRIVSASGKRAYDNEDKDNAIVIWDAQTGQELMKMEVNYTSIIKVSDTHTGQKKDILFKGTTPVNYAVFSPDGKIVLSASNDETIRLWDAQTGQELMKLIGHTGAVNSANFSLDGKRIVSASDDETIRLWDAQTGQELMKLEGHTKDVNSAVFSSDGQQIVSASSDNTIRIWDVPTGHELMKLEGHRGAVKSAAFSPDGKQIISASFDDTIRRWEFLPLQDLIDRIRKRYEDSKLTPEERKKYYLD